VARVGQQLLRRPLLDDPAEVHHGDPVRDVPGEAEVMGHHEDGDAGLAHQLQHQGEDLAAHRRVERGDGLVGDQQAGLQHHRAGDQHALTLAAGELVRVVGRAPLGKADQLEQLADPGARRSGAPVLRVQLDRLADLAADLHGVERVQRALEDDRHAGPAHGAWRCSTALGS